MGFPVQLFHSREIRVYRGTCHHVIETGNTPRLFLARKRLLMS